MNANLAIALIRQHGIYGLCASDGCACCHFEIHAVHVDIACHKSEHTVRVWAADLDRNPSELESVMLEVLNQLGSEQAAGYRIRFCADSYDDNYNGRRTEKEQKCCYCGRARATRQEYLCAECRQNEHARARYPWTEDGFLPVGLLV